MDPQACLQEYWEAYNKADRETCNERYDALRSWLERGGFEPDWSRYGYSRAEFFRAPHRNILFGRFSA